MVQRLRHGWSNGSRWKILRWMLALALAWAVGATTLLLLRPSPPDPFGSYPVQTIEAQREVLIVHDREAGTNVELELPVIHPDTEEVVVSGTKCIEGSDPVPVSGTVNWRQLQPISRILRTSEGSAVRAPGCESFRFANPIPPEVLDAHHASGETTVWQITGTEVSDDGARQTWATENFALVTS